MRSTQISQLATRLHELSTRDYFPSANRYVYWLKEPVGWFVVALFASVMVGVVLSPVGWSVAAGLATVILLGLGFPWLATRSVRCQLRPVDLELHERQHSRLSLCIANYLPIPITGLRIEGYMSISVDDEPECYEQTDCSLALVPAFSRATYNLPLRPEYRGTYPSANPLLTCSFPFGIWTARREVSDVSSVLVRPMRIPIWSSVAQIGSQWAELGPGSRPSTHGDFLGVRDFRDGDSLKSIHWAQSARNDRLVVCERGGPQQQTIDVQLTTERSLGTTRNARENLAWRVRVAASVCDILSSRHIPIRLWIDDRCVCIPPGPTGACRAYDWLAEVPLDGCATIGAATPWQKTNSPTLRILARDEHGDLLHEQFIQLELIAPGVGLCESRACHASHSRNVIDLDGDIADQLDQILTEADRVNCEI